MHEANHSPSTKCFKVWEADFEDDICHRMDKFIKDRYWFKIGKAGFKNCNITIPSLNEKELDALTMFGKTCDATLLKIPLYRTPSHAADASEATTEGDEVCLEEVLPRTAERKSRPEEYSKPSRLLE